MSGDFNEKLSKMSPVELRAALHGAVGGATMAIDLIDNVRNAFEQRAVDLSMTANPGSVTQEAFSGTTLVLDQLIEDIQVYINGINKIIDAHLG